MPLPSVDRQLTHPFILERLYQRQHPKDVKLIESEHYDLNAVHYWISKEWYKGASRM